MFKRNFVVPHALQSDHRRSVEFTYYLQYHLHKQLSMVSALSLRVHVWRVEAPRIRGLGRVDEFVHESTGVNVLQNGGWRFEGLGS
eukprot:1160996-Pelagomonas_calceolata.AAC.10